MTASRLAAGPVCGQRLAALLVAAREILLAVLGERGLGLPCG